MVSDWRLCKLLILFNLLHFVGCILVFPASTQNQRGTASSATEGILAIAKLWVGMGCWSQRLLRRDSLKGRPPIRDAWRRRDLVAGSRSATRRTHPSHRPGHARGGMVKRYRRALNLAIEAGGSCQGATIEAWPTVSVQKSSSSFRMKNAASRLDLRSCRPRNFALKNASSLR